MCSNAEQLTSTSQNGSQTGNQNGNASQSVSQIQSQDGSQTGDTSLAGGLTDSSPLPQQDSGGHGSLDHDGRKLLYLPAAYLTPARASLSPAASSSSSSPSSFPSLAHLVVVTPERSIVSVERRREEEVEEEEGGGREGDDAVSFEIEDSKSLNEEREVGLNWSTDPCSPSRGGADSFLSLGHSFLDQSSSVSVLEWLQGGGNSTEPWSSLDTEEQATSSSLQLSSTGKGFVKSDNVFARHSVSPEVYLSGAVLCGSLLASKNCISEPLSSAVCEYCVVVIWLVLCLNRIEKYL